MKVVIVGAGPAGLVMCKTLLAAASDSCPFDPIILEQEDDIGGTFRYRSYENASLVSSKQLTAFSDFRLPLDHPDHLSLEEYVDYLRAYVKHFKFQDRIRLRSKIVKIRRHQGGGHFVEYVQGDPSAPDEWNPTVHTIHAKYLSVCSGLHVLPNIPSIPGVEHVLHPKTESLIRQSLIDTEPQVYHSCAYKYRSQLSGRKVMILGTGETGMDLAYESVKAGAKEVVLCTRGGFLSFPKVLNDFELFGVKFEGALPIDGLITNLFETAYVHPWVAALHLRWFISDFVVKRVLWILTGTQAGCNQWIGELDPDRLGRAYVFLNKSHKAMPYINRPYRKRPAFLEYISRYHDPEEDSPPITNFAVDLSPFPSHFLPSGCAIFPLTKRRESIRMQAKSGKFRPDTLIYATGYTQDFGLFDPEGNYPAPSDCDVRDVFKHGDESISFIGFVRPGVGAIPPLAEMQAMFWTAIIQGTISTPTTPPHYHLLQKSTARILYGVDHSSYMATLAKDLGAAPSLLELWVQYGWHVLICYCFGAAFTPFYRLVGPFRSEIAPQVIKTELWQTITRRGILGNLAMGLIPMMFYAFVNTLALVAEGWWTVLGRPRFQLSSGKMFPPL